MIGELDAGLFFNKMLINRSSCDSRAAVCAQFDSLKLAGEAGNWMGEKCSCKHGPGYCVPARDVATVVEFSIKKKSIVS